MTEDLFLVVAGQWIFGPIAYGLALVGFFGAKIFYDSLLLSVSGANKLDVVSALGYALVYVGGKKSVVFE